MSNKHLCPASSFLVLCTLLFLLCFAGSGAEATSNELNKQLDALERRHFIELARSSDLEARERGYLHFTALLRSGDSSAQVTDKLCPPWSPPGTNYFAAQGPFSRWVPWTNQALTLEWQSGDKLQAGWPRLVFALFSDAQKTNLVDALLYNGAEGLQPLVDGPYSRKVLAIKPGDNMEAVFNELGRHRCEYFKGKDGKWRIRALYYTWDGRFINYEADAGTAIILRVWDGTL